MHPIQTRSLLAAAALLAAATPVAAQRAAEGSLRPAPADAPRLVPVVRPLAIYRFDPQRTPARIAEVTVADSAGTLVARYLTPLARVARPMSVESRGTDLVLRAPTSEGLLVLELTGQNGAARADAIAGQWALGGLAGPITGRPLVVEVAGGHR